MSGTRAGQRAGTRRPSQRHPRPFSIAMLAIIVISASLIAIAYVRIGAESALPPGELSGDSLATIAIFDVDQGLAVAVATSDGAGMVYDYGRSRSHAEDVILPFLRRHGISQVDYAILSHPHQDHVGGLPAFLEATPIRLYLDPVIETTNQTYLQSLQTVERLGISVSRARRGGEYRLGDHVEMEILWPTDDLLTESDGLHRINDNSTVVRLTVGEFDMLLTGDIEHDAESTLVDDYGSDLSVEVLQVPHHGSNSSNQDAFLQSTSPAVGIISLGAGNQYGHPHSEVIQRLRRHDVQTYRTDLDGTVIIETDGTDYEISTTRTDQSWINRDSGQRWTALNPIPTALGSPYWSSMMVSN